MKLLSYTTALPWGSGKWNSRGTPPRCGGGGGQWVVELPLYSATLPGAVGSGTTSYRAALPGGSGHWNSCGTLPHYLGVMGIGTAIVYYRIN